MVVAYYNQDCYCALKPMNLDSQPDPVVIEALKAGNRSALGILYDRYGALVYGLALRILHNSQDAEDLTQEIFMKFWQQGKFDTTRGTVPAYLLTMTRSRAIDLLRRRQSRQGMVERIAKLHSTATTDNSLEQVRHQEISEQVRRAMAQLPDYQRIPLELAYGLGLTQAEISAHLGVPLGTIKTRTRQGLLKLRQLLHNLVE